MVFMCVFFVFAEVGGWECTMLGYSGLHTDGATRAKCLIYADNDGDTAASLCSETFPDSELH